MTQYFPLSNFELCREVHNRPRVTTACQNLKNFQNIWPAVEKLFLNKCRLLDFTENEKLKTDTNSNSTQSSSSRLEDLIQTRVNHFAFAKNTIYTDLVRKRELNRDTFFSASKRFHSIIDDNFLR